MRGIDVDDPLEALYRASSCVDIFLRMSFIEPTSLSRFATRDSIDGSDVGGLEDVAGDDGEEEEGMKSGPCFCIVGEFTVRH